jgi:glycosyltransferase involved in cell wall biosynthesis
MPLTILFDATPFVSGRPTGAGRYVTAMLNELSRLDTENHYRVFGYEESWMMMENWPDNFTYEKLELKKWLGPLAREISRRRFVQHVYRNEGADVLHVNLDPVPPPGKKMKTVCTLYDVMRASPTYTAQGQDAPQARARTWLRYSIARRYDRLLTISNYSKEQIMKKLKIKSELISVTLLAADRAYTPGPADPEVLENLEIKQPFVLFVGQFGRQKNEYGLIKAFLEGCKREEIPPDVDLVMVGNKKKLPPMALRHIMVHPLGERVKFVGRVDDPSLVALYRAATVFTLPSFNEGFGLPVMEAMACGCPVVTSNVSSLPEIVGTAGLVIDPKSLDELRMALTRVLTEPTLRQQLGEMGLMRSAEFSFEEVAKTTLGLYRELCSENE